MTFAQRAIDVTFTLATGLQGDTQDKPVTLTGLRVQVEIESSAAPNTPTLNARIFGLNPEHLKTFTRIGRYPLQQRNNVIQISAGDVDGNMTTIFEGSISTALCNYQNMPESPLEIVAVSGGFAAAKPVAATSLPGPQSIVDLITIFANQATPPLTVVNDLTTTPILYNPNYGNTVKAKIYEAAKHAHINVTFFGNTVTLWDIGGSISNDTMPVISAANGMVGYPILSVPGLTIKNEFIPAVKAGTQCTVQSSLEMANGQWSIFHYKHILESETPNGAWFTELQMATAGPGV